MTVCGVLQFAAVKVSARGRDGALGDVLLDAIGIVTSAVGCDLSTTVNVTVPPASVVAGPLGVRR